MNRSSQRWGAGWLIGVALAAAALGVGGCAEQVLMPTPAIVAQGGIDPFQYVPPPRRTSTGPVFVVSGRAPAGGDTPATFFSNHRSQVLHLGVAEVAIGPDLDWAALRAASTAAKRSEAVAIRVTGYRDYGVLWTSVPPPYLGFAPDWTAPDVDRGPAEAFRQAVEAELALSHRKDITVFVHGFNTKFVQNLGIAAELWHYMGRDGVMISFDWPSAGDLLKYQVDKANADFSARQFRQLLVFLSEQTSAERINIIAHSAGGPIAVSALRDLSLMHWAMDSEQLQRKLRLGRVVLAAPDADLDWTVNAGRDGAGRTALSAALYASEVDKALDFSGGIFGDARLGESIKALTPEERAGLLSSALQAVDATNAQRQHSSFLGHSYFHENPWVSSDTLLFLAVGATPPERGLVRDPKTNFWSFPDDYGQKLGETARGLIERYGRREPAPAAP